MLFCRLPVYVGCPFSYLAVYFIFFFFKFWQLRILYMLGVLAPYYVSCRYFSPIFHLSDFVYGMFCYSDFFLVVELSYQKSLQLRLWNNSPVFSSSMFMVLFFCLYIYNQSLSLYTLWDMDPTFFFFLEWSFSLIFFDIFSCQRIFINELYARFL